MAKKATTTATKPAPTSTTSTTTTALAVYKNITNPLEFAMTFGKEIAHSKMFGCDNESQGKVLAMACLCEGQNPLSVARRHHIFGGKLTMKADAILADFRTVMGGDYDIISRTGDLAELKLTLNGKTYQDSFSWEEAQIEDYVKTADGLSGKTTGDAALKDNWKTHRRRKQMLWARLVSDMCKTFAPEIVTGVYTPEEVIDVEATVVSSGNGGPVDLQKLMADTAERVASEQQQQDDNVEDAEFEPVDAVPAPDLVPPTEPQQTEPSEEIKPSTPYQHGKIREAFNELGVNDEQITAILAKPPRNATALNHLTHEHAKDLLDGLRRKIKEKQDKQTEGDSQLPDNVTGAPNTAPADQSTIDQIKAHLQDDQGMVKRVGAFLQENGKKRLADLNHDQATLLLTHLIQGSMENFFAQSLEGNS